MIIALLAAANPNDVANAKTAGALACPLACAGFGLAFLAVIIMSMWKLFTKAGQPGWYSLVPFYNAYIMTCEIAKKDVMWFVLEFVPIISIYASFMVSMEIAKKFGKGEGFGLGLFFLPFIFLPMLAFGDAEYRDGRSRRRFAAMDDDDDDYDDRPRRRRRDEDYDDDDDDYEDRPRKRRKPRNDYDD